MFAKRTNNMSVHEPELRSSGCDSSPIQKKGFTYTPKSSCKITVQKAIMNDIR